MNLTKFSNPFRQREREQLAAFAATSSEIEERMDETKQDVDMLADTVLALCDILEGGEE